MSTSRDDRITALETELANFKQKTAEAISRYAYRDGWTDGINDLLADLGLELTPNRFAANITISLTIESAWIESTELPETARLLTDLEPLRDAIQDAITDPAVTDGALGGNYIETAITAHSVHVGNIHRI